MSIRIVWGECVMIRAFHSRMHSETNQNNHFNDASFQATPQSTGEPHDFLCGPFLFCLMRWEGDETQTCQKSLMIPVCRKTHIWTITPNSYTVSKYILAGVSKWCSSMPVCTWDLVLSVYLLAKLNSHNWPDLHRVQHASPAFLVFIIIG